MLEETLILAYFGGFLNPTAKVLIIAPQKNVFRNIWLLKKQLLAHDFAVKKPYLQGRKNEVNEHKKNHIRSCTCLVFQDYNKIISSIGKKLYCHGEKV
jgi:bifunctional ADP-heptose synthase (sugar kinase/adenylyltransferase)